MILSNCWDKFKCYGKKKYSVKSLLVKKLWVFESFYLKIFLKILFNIWIHLDTSFHFFLLFCIFIVLILFCIFSVLWKPVFRNHPQSTYAYVDAGVATVTLSCEADGFPHPVIGWLNNNSSVINGTVVQNGSVSTLVLNFTKTTEQLQRYRCVASNSIGSTLSKEATVTISVPGNKLHVRSPVGPLRHACIF